MNCTSSNKDVCTWVWHVLSKMKAKYENAGYDYATLAKYVIYLEPELPVPYEEAYHDLIEWSKALRLLGKINDNNEIKPLTI